MKSAGLFAALLAVTLLAAFGIPLVVYWLAPYGIVAAALGFLVPSLALGLFNMHLIVMFVESER